MTRTNIVDGDQLLHPLRDHLPTPQDLVLSTDVQTNNADAVPRQVPRALRDLLPKIISTFTTPSV